MPVCGALSCCAFIAGLPGKILAGCFPIAAGVYFGLFLAILATYQLLSTAGGSDIMFKLTWKNNGQDEYVHVYFDRQVNSVGGITAEISNDDENAYCYNAYQLWGSMGTFVYLCLFGGIGLCFTGAFHWWKINKIFVVIPFKLCIGRLMLWLDCIICLIVALAYAADGADDMKTAELAMTLLPGYTEVEYSAGPGAEGMMTSALYFFLASFCLTIFFAPEGQKLIPGFMAEEIVVDDQTEKAASVVTNEVNENEEEKK